MWASVTGVGWGWLEDAGWAGGRYDFNSKKLWLRCYENDSKKFWLRCYDFHSKSFKKILELERGPEAKAVPTVVTKGIRQATSMPTSPPSP